MPSNPTRPPVATSPGGGGHRAVGCLVLFALPFAGTGVYMAYRVVSALATWRAMQSWESVPAEILDVELATDHDSDSTTYEVRARYRYTYRGATYVGARVSLHSGSDNVGDFHQAVYQELAALHRAGVDTPCFVDPDHPENSVLYRDLRWELLGFYGLFVLLFGGTGVGLMVLAAYGSSKGKSAEDLKTRFPEEPWRQRDDWSEGRIRSSNKPALVASTLFALFWNLISLPLLFLLPREVLEKGNHAAAMGFLFPVVGVGLLVWAGRHFVRWRKFGESVFEMDSVPGVIGGTLRGRIHASSRVAAAEEFRLTLSCVQPRSGGRGKSGSDSEQVLWQTAQTLRREAASLDPYRIQLPVSFQIPYDAEPTGDSDGGDETWWRLELEAEVPGVDYAARFEVPVYRTGESSPDSVHDKGSATVVGGEPELASALESKGIRVELLPSGRRYVFPLGRHKGASLFLSLFFAIWTAITVVLWQSQAPRIFPWAFALFDLLFLWAVLDVWLYRSVVEVSHQGITVASGWLVLGARRQLARPEVKDIKPVRGMQVGSRLLYQLEGVTGSGKNWILAKRVGDLRLADRLAREMKGLLDLR